MTRLDAAACHEERLSRRGWVLIALCILSAQIGLSAVEFAAGLEMPALVLAVCSVLAFIFFVLVGPYCPWRQPGDDARR